VINGGEMSQQKTQDLRKQKSFKEIGTSHQKSVI